MKKLILLAATLAAIAWAQQANWIPIWPAGGNSWRAYRIGAGLTVTPSGELAVVFPTGPPPAATTEVRDLKLTLNASGQYQVPANAEPSSIAVYVDGFRYHRVAQWNLQGELIVPTSPWRFPDGTPANVYIDYRARQ